MPSRRDFLIMGVCAGALIAINAPVFARNGARYAKGATAITQVSGDGIRLTGIAVEYDAPVNSAELSAASFNVEGRVITGVFASTSADFAGRAAEGRFVIITLSPEDKNALLAEKVQSQNGDRKQSSGGMGPGKAGDIPVYDTIYKTAAARVVQSGPVTMSDGHTIPASTEGLETTKVENLIVDDFQQLEFHDPKTGKKLRYNLFVPKDYDAGKSYPLVLFMHDAGATSDVTPTTLYQGLGAVVWASPEDQAKRPCFVLAPQYAEIIADDDSQTSDMLDTTINLINTLAEQYRIDRNRLYTTGQSGGCMMSIAMDIKYPTFFAASFLVAGQWEPALVKPLARQKLWILVSQDDNKAYPGQNAITAALEKDGAKISRAVWDGTWTPEQFRAAFEKIDAEGSPINYVTFRKGTVIPENQSAEGASGHRNTWRIAYTIEPIREWIFRQNKNPFQNDGAA
ncbi:peptidase [Brenneria roseae subsp. roseae]|uniref:carboxylesterase family protein n=1 Tax=Brenneria roseae TaxID=1509241 RepID=UPI000D60FE41|nr:PHB depolymerase family esterase [Brenneria roseae]PWC22306.1 peptidase [Brenneria roseae subsp. roseae]